jgi:hypothetical protein
MTPGPRDTEEAKYANYFRVGFNAFEFLLEFGQQEGRIHTSIYVNPQHARKLCDLLQGALEVYEEDQNRTMPQRK